MTVPFSDAALQLNPLADVAQTLGPGLIEIMAFSMAGVFILAIVVLILKFRLKYLIPPVATGVLLSFFGSTYHDYVRATLYDASATAATAPVVKISAGKTGLFRSTPTNLEFDDGTGFSVSPKLPVHLGDVIATKEFDGTKYYCIEGSNDCVPA